MDEPRPQMTVLIVEDDQVLLGMLANMLAKNNFKVLEAKNGIEGIEAVNECEPDLILLDIDMPKMGGIGMLQNLVASGKHMPVIMLTNLNSPNMIANAAELGVKEYLIKSDWEIDDIMEKIKKRLHIES